MSGLAVAGAAGAVAAYECLAACTVFGAKGACGQLRPAPWLCEARPNGQWLNNSWVKTLPGLSLRANGGGAACAIQPFLKASSKNRSAHKSLGRLWDESPSLALCSTLLASMDVIPFLVALLERFCRHPVSLTGVSSCVVPTFASASSLPWSVQLGCWCHRSRLVLRYGYLAACAPLGGYLLVFRVNTSE